MGKQLTDFTTRKVIMMVLIMLFTNPLFMVSTYITEPYSYSHGIDLIRMLDNHNSHRKFISHDKLFDSVIKE